MKKILTITLLVIYVVFSIAIISFSKVEWKDEWPQRVRIGAATIGGGFYMGASALANVIQEEFSGVELVVEQTKASVHNTMLIEDNQIEFGMNVTEVAWQAWHGEGVFEKEYRNFRVLTSCWPGMKVFFTMKDSGINSVADLEGKKVSAITAGSAIDSFVRSFFDALDIEAEIVNLTSSDSRMALENGLIDAVCMGHPSPIMQELSYSKDIHLVPISGKEIEPYQKKHPEVLYDMFIPAGYYNKVDEEVVTLGNYNIIMANANLPDDCVYSVTKALYENIDLVHTTYPPFAEHLKSLDVSGVNTPFHEGALQYYEEIGVKVQQ